MPIIYFVPYLAQFLGGVSAPPTMHANDVIFHLDDVYPNSRGDSPSFFGSPVLVSGQKKYGTTALSLNGTSTVTYPSASYYPFLRQDFTLEFWVNPTSLAGIRGLIDFRDLYGSVNQRKPTVYLYDGTIRFFLLGSDRAISGPIPTNEWTHVALTRAQNYWRLFVNGVQVGDTTYDTGSISSASTMFIGGVSDNPTGTGNMFTGHIDEIRMNNTFAHYTTNFTPPTEPFTIP